MTSRKPPPKPALRDFEVRLGFRVSGSGFSTPEVRKRRSFDCRLRWHHRALHDRAGPSSSAALAEILGSRVWGQHH